MLFFVYCLFSVSLPSDLLQNGNCIENLRLTDTTCNPTFSKNWPYLASKMIRFKVGFSICDQMIQYGECFSKQLQLSNCDPNAIWNRTHFNLIKTWCYGFQYSSASSVFNIPNYSQLIFYLVIIFGIGHLRWLGVRGPY